MEEFEFSVSWTKDGISCKEFPLAKTHSRFVNQYRLTICQGVILQFDIFGNEPSYGGLLWLKDPSQRCPRFVLGMKNYYIRWKDSIRVSDNNVTDAWVVVRS